MLDAIDWVSQSSDAYQHYGEQIYKLVIEADADIAVSSLYLLADKDQFISATIIDKISTKIFELVSEEGFNVDNIALALPNNDFSDSIIEATLLLILPYRSSDNAISLID